MRTAWILALVGCGGTPWAAPLEGPVPPGQLMFGSDWPLVDIGDYAAAFARAVPAEQQPAVFHDNAVRVFGLRP